jgi:hypothetical protein
MKTLVGFAFGTPRVKVTVTKIKNGFKIITRVSNQKL